MLLSVVELMLPVLVPPLRANTTVEPPLVSKLLLASRPVKVIVTFEPEDTVALVKLIVDCENEIAPGLTVIVGKILVTAFPPIVAPIVVALPETNALKVAE